MILIKPRYRFLHLNSQGGFNKTFIILKYFDIFGFEFLPSKWVGKLTVKLSTLGDPMVLDILDMDNRSMLAYRLAKKLAINIPRTELISFDQIERCEQLSEVLNPSRYYNFSKIVISKFITGERFDLNTKALERVKNTDILNLFIFDCWLGNFDKKIEDYIIDKQNKLWSIDYQLWGPRDTSYRTLGYCARVYGITIENFKKYCLPKPLWQHLTFDKFLVDKFISKIKKLSKKYLEKTLDRYKFINQRGESLNDTLLMYLCTRVQNIESDIGKIFME